MLLSNVGILLQTLNS